MHSTEDPNIYKNTTLKNALPGHGATVFIVLNFELSPNLDDSIDQTVGVLCEQTNCPLPHSIPHVDRDTSKIDVVLQGV